LRAASVARQHLQLGYRSRVAPQQAAHTKRQVQHANLAALQCIRQKAFADAHLRQQRGFSARVMRQARRARAWGPLADVEGCDVISAMGCT
jgi:hypothetical protein